MRPPAATPRPERSAPWRPGAVLTLRVLARFCGTVCALTELYLAGLVALMSDCSRGFVSFCADDPGVVY